MCVIYQFTAQVTMAFNKREKWGEKKEKEKRQPCTYYVCVSQEMNSVKHLLLT